MLIALAKIPAEKCNEMGCNANHPPTINGDE